jgi:hypothetical protein
MVPIAVAYGHARFAANRRFAPRRCLRVWCAFVEERSRYELDTGAFPTLHQTTSCDDGLAVNMEVTPEDLPSFAILVKHVYPVSAGSADCCPLDCNHKVAVQRIGAGSASRLSDNPCHSRRLWSTEALSAAA